MNDAYIGDIGDYGKYGLLKTLKQETGFQLGVAWMKTASPVFEYLERDELVACDPELYQSLRGLVRGSRRTIAGLEESKALPEDTIYFNKQFVFRGKKAQQRLRSEWFGEALDRLEDANLVFFDPDNGLETSLKKGSTVEGPKNVRYKELKPFYERGKSLVVYQHAERRKGGMKETIRVRTSDLKGNLGVRKYGRYGGIEYSRESIS